MSALALVRPADDPVSARPAVPHLRLVPPPGPATDPEPETLAPGKRGRQTTPRRRADTCESSQNSAELLTPEEAAEFLRISPRTLSNWRMQGKGPAYRKIGARVVYPRATMLTWGLECPGFGRNGRPQVKVTTRPYAKDPTRRHVDVMFPHPLQPGQIYRKRIVAPAGLDAQAATVWGEKQGQEILYALIRGAPPAPVDVPAPPTPALQPSAAREVTTAKQQSRKAAPPAPALVSRVDHDDTEVMTLADLWEQFRIGYVDEQKPATRVSFQSAWGHIAPVLGAMRCDAIDKRAIGLLRSSLRSKKLAASSRNLFVSKLVKALRWGMEYAGLADRVIDTVPEDFKKRHKDVYTLADVDRILAACDRPRTDAQRDDGWSAMQERVLVLLCFHGALRVGETCGLKWTDIDWGANTMTISRNVHKCVLQETPKGETGIVPLSAALAAALRQLHALQGGASPFVLQRPGGLHTNDGANAKRVALLQRIAGVPVFGPHRLRHSALTHGANNGASPYALQALARHADLATTNEYYVHLNSANVARQAVALFDPAPSAPGTHHPAHFAQTGNGWQRAVNRV